jgi:hypothetical protein
MPKGVYPHTHVRPKTYPADVVSAVERLYAHGLTQVEIASELGRTQKVIWRVMKNHGIAARVAAKRNQRGPDNHAWKGDEAGYSALHLRVVEARGKPTRCAACDTVDPERRYEWANLTGDYTDIADYIRLCLPCHRRFDGYRRAVTGERTSPEGRFA